MTHRVGRGRRGGQKGQTPVANAEVMRAMKRLEDRMVAMETSKRRDPKARDVSEEEEESQ